MPKKTSKVRVTKRCARCVLPDTYPGIMFNGEGVCSVCLEWEKRRKIDYTQAEEELRRIVERYRKENEKCRYDCVVGVSGGKDSTYVIYYLAKVLKLRVLAANFSVGFNSLTAQANVLKAIDRLGIDMFALRINWEKLRRIYSIFLRYTGGLCVPCNTQKIRAIKTAALTFGIKIIFSGVSRYDSGSVDYGAYTNDVLKEVLSKEMNSREIEEFLIPEGKDYQYYHLDQFVERDVDKVVSTIQRELGWENPTKRLAQKGYQRLHHTDCDWFPMDCYFRWQSGGFDRLTMANSIAIRKGEKIRAAALKRESMAKKQNTKLPPFAPELLKKIGISVKDIRLEKI